MLATILTAIRNARDSHADVITRAGQDARDRAAALEKKVDKLSADISDLADATRAVLRQPAKPAPPAAKAPMTGKPPTKEKM